MTALSTTPHTSTAGDHERGEMGVRGRTTIADRVVERLAARAVTEVDGVGGTVHRMLGVAVGGEGVERAAQVHARVTGDTASLEVRLSVIYPASVARTTDQARTHLMRRIAQFTGLAVTRVDIRVTALHSDTPGRRGVR
ncbi:Asp23/Gls24 family envelope stress response protein [Amycolatopsis anabasis]|uniref:Asp23/Gls24 family envelope stress response protein n=1 Tax=Amycolatopsis anabasis TaxID=1840409 RepID=UPI00131E1DFA|nr:Asp23/Gls24 family envelope stress response protein [Amycolatopsis anabasis]